MNEEREVRLKKTLKVASIYFNLEHNDDFIKWRKVEVDARIERLGLEILNVDRNNPNWEKEIAPKVAAYQEIRDAFYSCFKKWEWKDKEARAKLKDNK